MPDHEYYIKNKERLNDYTRKYYLIHKGEILARTKKYYIQNRSLILNKTHIYRKNNHDKFLATCRASRRRRYLKNPEYFIQDALKWRKANPEKHKVIMRRAYKKWRYKTRMAVLSHYSPSLECAMCKTKDARVLSIDHINNGGTSHVKKLGYRGSAFYYWLKKHNFPNGYQVLCMNCNWLKQTVRYKNMNSTCRKREQEIKKIVFTGYSPTTSCAMCNNTNLDLLSLDHINGGGREECRKLGVHGYGLYRWLYKQYNKTKQWPIGYQILCWNCQRIKEYRSGI